MKDDYQNQRSYDTKGPANRGELDYKSPLSEPQSPFAPPKRSDYRLSPLRGQSQNPLYNPRPEDKLQERPDDLNLIYKFRARRIGTDQEYRKAA